MERNLLERYIEGNVTDREIEIVVAWMKEDEKHLEEVRALRKLYAISLFNNPFIRLPEKEQAAETGGFNYRKAIYEFLKIAAVVLIAWCGFQWIYKDRQSEQYQTLFVPAGQRAELTLADSTKVWLNSLSKITYPTNFNENSRRVELEGEAYFDVSRDRKRPFIVKTQHLNIKVLGTKFNVIDYSSGGSTEVALLEGSVELLPEGASRIYKMKENEQVCIPNNGDTVYASPIKNYDYFEWKNGLICFDDEPVARLLNKLEIYYDVKIIDRNTSFMNKNITGKFRSKDGIEHVLKVLQVKEKFKFERDEEKNIIIIK